MADAVERMIKALKERIKADERGALEDALDFTTRYPDKPAVWNTLAFAYQWEEKYSEAIAAMNRVIELEPREPAYFDHRGRYALMAGDYDLAIADFSRGLVLCDEWNNDYYRQPLHFQRAEAFLQLGRKAEALADLHHVDDDHIAWTIQVRSKAELLALCSA